MTGYGGQGPLNRFLGDDEDGDDHDEESTLGPGKKRVAPEGTYRILGTDNWAAPTDPDWVVGDYPSKQEALKIAREKNKAAAGGKVLDPGDPRDPPVLRLRRRGHVRGRRHPPRRMIPTSQVDLAARFSYR